MNELLFSICTYVALAGWLLLIVLPGWKPTRALVLGGAVSLLIAGVYLFVVLLTLAEPGEGGFGSLEAVAQLFQNPKALLAGWIHYLSFDLFIGAWEVGNARRNGIPHLLVVPCLVLTCLYGPIGFLLYFLLRTVWLKRG